MTLTDWLSRRFGEREGQETSTRMTVYQGTRGQPHKSAEEQVFGVVL